jgi:hypothetical protein
MLKKNKKCCYSPEQQHPNTYNYMKKPLQAAIVLSIAGAKVLLFSDICKS